MQRVTGVEAEDSTATVDFTTKVPSASIDRLLTFQSVDMLAGYCPIRVPDRHSAF